MERRGLVSNFQDVYGLNNVLEIAMASATFGLIIGGIIGSPMAERLVDKHGIESEYGRSAKRMKNSQN